MKKVMHVLFHIDEEEKWSLLCSNVNNLIRESENQNATVIVEVLANSIAVKNLSATNSTYIDLKENLSELKNKGVFIYACENSLRNLNIDKSFLFPFIETVPLGVYHIVLRENEGFAYIKP